MSNILEVRNLCKAYEDFSLDNVSFSLPYGKIIGLIGENGAGKSTVIKCILNIIHKQSGEIKIFGEDIEKNAVDIKQRIGVVFNESRIPKQLNPNQVEKIASNIFKTWDTEKYHRCLKDFGLSEKKKYKDFSSAMKMKLSMAIALSHNAELLILDEAASCLDPTIYSELLDLLSEFVKDDKHSVIMSSGIANDLKWGCDIFLLLYKGRVIMCEDKERFIGKHRLVLCSEDRLNRIKDSDILCKKNTFWGIEAIVAEEAVPEGCINVRSMNIEDVFVFMTGDESIIG